MSFWNIPMNSFDEVFFEKEKKKLIDISWKKYAAVQRPWEQSVVFETLHSGFSHSKGASFISDPACWDGDIVLDVTSFPAKGKGKHKKWTGIELQRDRRSRRACVGFVGSMVLQLLTGRKWELLHNQCLLHTHGWRAKLELYV